MKTPKAPEVLDGLRSPSDFPARDEEPVTATSSALPEPPKPAGPAAVVKPGLRRYASAIRALLLTVSRPRVFVIDGEAREEDGKKAQFRDGFFSTSDPEIIAKLDGHTGFGLDYWDLDKVKAEAEKRAEDEWVAKVKANPDLRQKLRVAIGTQEFDLGDPPAAP